MRASSTYRAQRRNSAKKNRKNFNLNPQRQFRWEDQIEGSKNHSVEPSHFLFIPPTRANKKLAEGEIRHRRVVIRNGNSFDASELDASS